MNTKNVANKSAALSAPESDKPLKPAEEWLRELGVKTADDESMRQILRFAEAVATLDTSRPLLVLSGLPGSKKRAVARIVCGYGVREAAVRASHLKSCKLSGLKNALLLHTAAEDQGKLGYPRFCVVRGDGAIKLFKGAGHAREWAMKGNFGHYTFRVNPEGGMDKHISV